MAKIRDLNPHPDLPRPIGGTDLGIPFVMPNGRVGYVYGDTFGGTTQIAGGPDWRSPVIVTSPTRDMTQPIVIDGACRGGDQLWPYVHNNPEFSTVLPCDALVIGGRIYLWVMVTQGLGSERWCEIWYSDDNGETWHNGTSYATPGVGASSRWSTAAFRGQRVMMTWDRGRDGWVYAISTGGLARNKNALLWRVREADILDPAKWEGWCWLNNQWQWKANPADHEPGDILPAGTRLGEIGLRWIQGHWVFSGFDAGAYEAFVRTGYGPISGVNWGTAPKLRPVRGGGLFPVGYDVQANLYGCYVHPDSKFEKPDGTKGQFVMIVSQWNGQNGQGPYRAMQYRFTAPNKLGTLLADPAPNDAGGQPVSEWDPILAEILGTS
ncbi:hypothetical protein IM25_22650 [Rhodococcus sp. p52]|uniref:DUF4185 domain-containing protein n=1 Tax=Rhodococcus sp. p52 TaxID=935199 RepID=UPI00068FC8BE|nr:DUF4185 domain-containing protein [Rhodococcus sp. p52]AOD24033.1 hypothetical protein IM25_22650 [Rhodococcus sp. p52]